MIDERKEPKIDGIIPAIITPFTSDEELDIEGLRENVRYLLDSGVHGILCSGSTGEGVALTHEERRIVARTVIQEVGGKVPVIVNTGGPSTKETVELTKDAKTLGADAALVVTPYYLIPNSDGLYEHYRFLDDAVDLPIILYNIPQHTVTNVDAETLSRLAELEHLVGIKDSSGNLSQISEMLNICGSKISVLTGCDDQVFAAFALGSPGAILALGNIAPKDLVEIYDAVSEGDLQKAKRLHYKLLPIARAISVVENFPAVVKTAVNLLGRPAGPARRPSVRLSQEDLESLRRALLASGLI